MKRRPTNTFRICLIASLTMHIILINTNVELVRMRAPGHVIIEVLDMPKETKSEPFVLELPKATPYSKFVKSAKKEEPDEIRMLPFGEVRYLRAGALMPFPDLRKTYRTISIDKLETKMVPPSIIGGTAALKRRLDYPFWMIPFAIEDTVIADVHVSWEGMADSIVIVKRPGFDIFTDKVVGALKRTRFNPALQNGAPVPRGCWIRIPFFFQVK